MCHGYIYRRQEVNEAERIAERRKPRIEITKLSVPDAPYETFGVSVYGIDGRDHEAWVMRDSLSVTECGIMARGLEQIIQRKMGEAIREFAEAVAEKSEAEKEPAELADGNDEAFNDGIDRVIKLLLREAGIEGKSNGTLPEGEKRR